MKNTGKNFDSNRDVKEIAKLVRKDIKRLFPTIKASVRIDRYSMGCSLDVTIRACDFQVANTDRVVHELAGSDNWPPPRILSPEASDLSNKIQDILNDYNRQDIDHMSDYYNVHFSGSVEFCRDLHYQSKRDILANMGVDSVDSGDLAYLYR